MKTKIIPFILFFTLLLSCEDTTYKEYKGNVPVYMTYEEFRGAVTVEDAQNLENPGKIYFKDNYIFIIEELKGIHVYDNSDPASPVKKSFVKVPGIADMAIAGNILYADSFVDLVVLDLNDISSIHEAGRVKDIFPYTIPPVNNQLPVAYVDKEKGLVVEWEVKNVKERYYQNPGPYPFAKVSFEGAFDSNSWSFTAGSPGMSSGGVGIGGSMARFGIKDNILYMVDQSTLRLMDISSESGPVKMFDMNIGWGIETMFLTENNMFLGTNTGMIIYDITTPGAPRMKSTYSHVRSCDPVIVDDTLAYVTLRSGTNCGGTMNNLDVVSIKDITSPELVISYPMTNPHGLGKSGDILFICDGTAGLKIYDASDPKMISANMKKAYTGIKAYDVIPVGDILVMIGDDGMYQYDYSNINDIRLLSTIPVVKD